MGHPESVEGTEFRILWKGQSLIPLAKKICDRGYNDFLLLRSELREYRQRQYLRGSPLTLRKSSGRIPQAV